MLSFRPDTNFTSRVDNKTANLIPNKNANLNYEAGI